MEMELYKDWFCLSLIEPLSFVVSGLVGRELSEIHELGYVTDFLWTERLQVRES